MAADGEWKWIAAGRKHMALVEGNQRPRVYPILQQRSKVAATAATTKGVESMEEFQSVNL